MGAAYSRTKIDAIEEDLWTDELIMKPPGLNIKRLLPIGGLVQQKQSMQNRCRFLEADYLECLDNVGPSRGEKECRDFLMDLKECAYHYTQKARIKEINQRKAELYSDKEAREKHRQEWIEKERKRDEECAKSWQ